MKPTSTDSHDSDSLKAQVASLNARIEALLAQNAELIAQNKALNEQIATQSARIAELEAQLGKPPKTPDNSSTPPSRGHKARGEERAAKPRRKGRPGAARALCARQTGSAEPNHCKRVNKRVNFSEDARLPPPDNTCYFAKNRSKPQKFGPLPPETRSPQTACTATQLIEINIQN